MKGPPPVSNPFEALFNNASAGIIVVDSKGTITMANDFALGIFQYKRPELLGQSLSVLIPAPLRKMHTQHHKAYFEQSDLQRMETARSMKALRKGGKEFPVEISLGHYQVDGQKYAIAVINDITEKKKKEEELRKLAESLERKVEQRTQKLHETVAQLQQRLEDNRLKDEALQKTNRFLNNLLSNTGIMIIASNEKGIIRIFNPTAQMKTGYLAADLIGKPDPGLFICPEETLPIQKVSTEGRRSIECMNTMASIAADKNVVERECLFIRKDESRFPVSLNVSTLYDDENRVQGYVGVAIDITERKKYLKDLQLALEKEKQLGELKSRFVSMASHEFRTPLSTILSSVYLLSKYTQTEDQPKREKHIRRIETSITLMNDILNDFLSMGKIEEGKLQARWSEFEITQAVREAMEEMQAALKPGQYFDYSHSGNDTVRLDPALFKHIIMNLLSNAAKFSGENAPIRILTDISEEEVTLRVRDQGMGIPAADQPHLFERFFRASNADNIKGTGLGLYIVTKYAEQMNGRVSFHSELEKGTEFTIHFNPK